MLNILINLNMYDKITIKLLYTLKCVKRLDFMVCVLLLFIRINNRKP